MFEPSSTDDTVADSNVQINPEQKTETVATPSAPSKSDPVRITLSDVDLTKPDTAGPNSLDPKPQIPPAPSWSPQILAWQSENLPTRPTLPIPPDKSFPTCAEEMKAQDITEITKESARSCFRLLDQFNSNILLPYQVHYHPYTDQVERAARNQSDAQILDFLQLEYFNLTDSEGADFLRFNEISNKFDGDRRWVQRLK